MLTSPLIRSQSRILWINTVMLNLGILAAVWLRNKTVPASGVNALLVLWSSKVLQSWKIQRLDQLTNDYAYNCLHTAFSYFYMLLKWLTNGSSVVAADYSRILLYYYRNRPIKWPLVMVQYVCAQIRLLLMTEGKELICNNVSLNTPLTNMKKFMETFRLQLKWCWFRF